MHMGSWFGLVLVSFSTNLLKLYLWSISSCVNSVSRANQIALLLCARFGSAKLFGPTFFYCSTIVPDFSGLSPTRRSTSSL